MGFEVKNANVVIKLVTDRIDAIEKAFEPILQDETTRMVQRIQSGKDVDGNPFTPYTPEYEKFKSAKGRKTSPVDLTFTGNMLNAITSKVEKFADKIVGTIFFNSAREAAKARGNQDKRPFFGLSEEQVQRITEKLRDAK
jgi:phage gpG-like protein